MKSSTLEETFESNLIVECFSNEDRNVEKPPFLERSSTNTTRFCLIRDVGSRAISLSNSSSFTNKISQALYMENKVQFR